MTISKSLFGIFNEKEIYLYKLKNEFLEIGILNYGGIINYINFKDKNGNIENMVLGFNTLEDYLEKSPYFGCITGRYAGRIKNACFTLNNEIHYLEKNDNNNNLHGGNKGFDKKIWNVNILENGLMLSYFSQDKEEGFPGNLKVSVKYILKNNSLEIEYTAIPDTDTLVNLTNHTYFNLSGGHETIQDHSLRINSNYFMELDKFSIVTGNKIKVDNTPFDFRKIKRIGKDINEDHIQLSFTNGYDHPFILNSTNKPQIELLHNKSGRKLEIITSEEAIVFYSGNYLKSEGLLNNGQIAKKQCGLCLETQQIPNKINLKNLTPDIFNKENQYRSKTKYIFSLI